MMIGTKRDGAKGDGSGHGGDEGGGRKSRIAAIAALAAGMAALAALNWTHWPANAQSNEQMTATADVLERRLAAPLGTRGWSAAGRNPVYYPGTEKLAPNEMRVVALGTGMPLARKSQASSGWLVELGNGDRFIFDLGTGSTLNFSTLGIPYGEVDKVFLSHLHTDHAGDLAMFWVSGWVAGRLVPLQIWGPSGATPELGTEHFVKHTREAYRWDTTSRHGKLPAAGADITVHEFDFAKPQVIYEARGVTISSFPAVHILDGPVSFRLDWNGRSFVFSGDTTPNKWFIERAKDAEIVIHETFQTVTQLMERWDWDRRTATLVGTIVHTAPSAAGRVFAEVKPRLAVGYHFYNDFDTATEVERDIRKTYQGPLVLAQDLMVINVTDDAVTVRMSAGPANSWPVLEGGEAFANAPRAKNEPMSDWLWDGHFDFD